MKYPSGAAALLVCAALAVTAAGTMQAQYAQTLPAYLGSSYSGPYPGPTTTVGTFTGIPGGTVTAATLSGYFGSPTEFQRYSTYSSAAVRVYFGSILVAQCRTTDPCYQYHAPAPTPWSFTFTPAQFAALAGPTATLTTVQDAFESVQLGATTLNISYATTSTTTPEPETVALLGTGLVALVPAARRRIRS